MERKGRERREDKMGGWGRDEVIWRSEAVLYSMESRQSFE